MPKHTFSADQDLAQVLYEQNLPLRWADLEEHPEHDGWLAGRHGAVMQEGEELQLPEPTPKEVTVETGRTHEVVHRPLERRLRLRLVDQEGNLRELDYELDVDGETRTGTTVRGMIDELISMTTTEATLRVEGTEYTLHVGRLDPISTLRGLRARLHNLGFLPHGAEGEHDANVVEAVRAFQLRERLPVTGQADPETRRRLVAVHGV